MSWLFTEGCSKSPSSVLVDYQFRVCYLPVSTVSMSRFRVPRLPANFACNAAVLEMQERWHEIQAALPRPLGHSVFSASRRGCGVAESTARHRRLERLAIEAGYPSTGWPQVPDAAGSGPSGAR